jgi:hypothetical protein
LLELVNALQPPTEERFDAGVVARLKEDIAEECHGLGQQ